MSDSESNEGRRRPRLTNCGCIFIGGILFSICIAIAVGLITMTVFKSGAYYRHSLDMAKAHPLAIELLGEPMEEGWLVVGSARSRQSSGKADIRYPLVGPKNAGVMHVQAIKEDGKWRFKSVQLKVGETDTVNLLVGGKKKTAIDNAGDDEPMEEQGDSDDAEQ